MSKPAGELTKAIRSLCDETNFEITHTQARTRLPAMGHPVVTEQQRKSPEYAKWEEYEVDYTSKASVKAVAAECGFDDATLKAVLAEHKVRVEFKAEANNFNVTKRNWKIAKESGAPSVSVKPDAAKNTKSRTAVATKVQEMVVGGDDLAFVEKNGGLAACKAKQKEIAAKVEKAQADIAKKQARIEKMQAEAAALGKSVAAVAELKKRLAAA